MSSPVSSGVSAAGTLPLRAALVLASASWVLLFALAMYTELVEGTVQILLIDLALMAAPFLIARWFLKQRRL